MSRNILNRFERVNAKPISLRKEVKLIKTTNKELFYNLPVTDFIISFIEITSTEFRLAADCFIDTKKFSGYSHFSIRYHIAQIVKKKNKKIRKLLKIKKASIFGFNFLIIPNDSHFLFTIELKDQNIDFKKLNTVFEVFAEFFNFKEDLLNLNHANFFFKDFNNLRFVFQALPHVDEYVEPTIFSYYLTVHSLTNNQIILFEIREKINNITKNNIDFIIELISEVIIHIFKSFKLNQEFESFEYKNNHYYSDNLIKENKELIPKLGLLELVLKDQINEANKMPNILEKAYLQFNNDASSS